MTNDDHESWQRLWWRLVATHGDCTLPTPPTEYELSVSAGRMGRRRQRAPRQVPVLVRGQTCGLPGEE